jgi:ribosomal protein L29
LTAPEVKKSIAGIMTKVKNGECGDTIKLRIALIARMLQISALQFKYEKYRKDGGSKIALFEGENPFSPEELKDLRRDLAAVRKALREQK